jgi:DNA-binding beta-propeller fold protein YncE
VTANDDIIVADTNNHRVQVFNPSGGYIRQIGSGPYGTDDARLIYPQGVATDPSGRIYVADVGLDRIKVFTSTGTFVRQWGAAGTGNGQFMSPSGIAVNTTGYVYVADTLNYRVQEFTPSGTYVRQWGNRGSENGNFSYFYGIAVNATGYVYVADSNGNRVQVFTPSGTYIQQWGHWGDADGYFSAPYGIAVNTTGYVYVADTSNNRVQVFTPSGTYVRQWGHSGTNNGEFSKPGGITVNTTGYVYVADTNNHRVQVFTPSGTYVRQWGKSGDKDGNFSAPYGIAVTANDDIVVADSYNNRIQEFTPSGAFVQKWGSNGVDKGQFALPYGIAADGSGNVYVADTGNSRIQKFGYPGIQIISPDGGNTWKQGSAQTITWSYTGSPGPKVKIELLKGTVVNRTINASTSIGSAGSGSYSWIVPYNQVLGTDYKIRITSTTNAVYTDRSDANFTISAGAPITVVVPNGGQNWKRGSSQTIRWSYTGNPGSKVKIELLKGSAVNRTINASTSIGSGGSGSYSWTVPYNQVLGTDYKIRITSTSNAVNTDRSDANFTISAGAPVTVMVPNGGQNWIRGSSHTITWKYTGNPGSRVKIELLKGAAVNRVINASTTTGSAGSGSYGWTIPTNQVVGSDFRIRIMSTSNATCTDQSNANFTISAP